MFSFRNEIIREVFNAPVRRIDNEISRLSDACRALQVHLTVLGGIVDRYQEEQWRVYRSMALSSAVCVGLTAAWTWAAIYLPGVTADSTATSAASSSPSTSTPTASTSTSTTAGSSEITSQDNSSVSTVMVNGLRGLWTSAMGLGAQVWATLIQRKYIRATVGVASAATHGLLLKLQWQYQQNGLESLAQRLSDPSMAEQRSVFERLFDLDRRKAAAKSSQIEALWETEAEHLRHRFSYKNFKEYANRQSNRSNAKETAADLAMLNRIIDSDIPSLRAQASPGRDSLVLKPVEEGYHYLAAKAAGETSVTHSISLSSQNKLGGGNNSVSSSASSYSNSSLGNSVNVSVSTSSSSASTPYPPADSESENGELPSSKDGLAKVASNSASVEQTQSVSVRSGVLKHAENGQKSGMIDGLVDGEEDEDSENAPSAS